MDRPLIDVPLPSEPEEGIAHFINSDESPKPHHDLSQFLGWWVDISSIPGYESTRSAIILGIGERDGKEIISTIYADITDTALAHYQIDARCLWPLLGDDGYEPLYKNSRDSRW
jgi:hypothetical protein